MSRSTNGCDHGRCVCAMEVRSPTRRRFAALVAWGIASAGCLADDRLATSVQAITCPEAVYISARGNPIGVTSGHIRWCFPGESRCFCDSDGDCYAESGYVPCTPPSAVDGGADTGGDARVDATPDAASGVCSEAVYISARGNPIGVTSGDIRWCFPGEALCHCDSDGDCYAQPGYVPCAPPSGSDAGADASADASADARADVASDASLDAGADASGGVCPEAVYISARGNPIGVVSGDIRWCFPGEARCHCDSDGDCYAASGYVPCTPPSGSADGGVDATIDRGPDVATDVPPVDGDDQLGRWGAIQRWPYAAVHSSLLPDGRVIFWSDDHLVSPYIWNPTTGSLTDTGFTRTELHCVGQSFLSDGRLFLTGGEPVSLRGAGVGVSDTNLFDFRTSTFSSGPTMRDLRWYPTNTTLPNGEVLITAGTRSSPADNNLIPEVYGVDGTLRSLTGASRSIETYPYMFLAPNGQVFQAGPDAATWYLDPTGAGRWLPLTAFNLGAHYVASAVMYDVGRVLVVGGSPGGPAPTASAEVIDLRASSPRWSYTSSMRYARRDHNATLLPDGRVLVIGGTGTDGGYVLTPELWDPSTGAFSPLAPVTIGRAYHSESLLMLDGRVLFAGGNDWTMHANMQLWTPYYLFRGARPTVSAAPATVSYGDTFTVSTPDAASITALTWMRLGSVTHGFDQNQRINRLAFTATAGALTATAPSDPRLCPPGHYILFALNGRGVPSEGRVMQIR